MKKVLYILGAFEDDDAEWLASAGGKRSLAQGDALIREGEPTASVYFVIRGSFVVSTKDGGDIARVGTGDVLGEISYVDRRPPTATVTAAEECAVLAVPKEDLSRKLDEDPGFGSRFYRAIAMFLADRLRSTIRQLGGLEASEEEDELDLDTLDSVSKAGVRFERILHRLQEV